jgi:hypothetical protein
MAEVTTLANVYSWDTSAYFSDEPSVTLGPEYLDEVMEEEHEEQSTTVKSSNDFIFFIVSAPPKILKMENLVENQEQTKTFPDSKTNKSVFIEFGQQSNSGKSSNPEGEETSRYEYENFWENDEGDDAINLERRDNSNNDKWKEIDDIDNDLFLETVDIEVFNAIDLNKKSQPLTISETEEIIFNKTNTKNDLEKSVKIDNDLNQMLSTAGIAGGGIISVCSLLGTAKTL